MKRAMMATAMAVFMVWSGVASAVVYYTSFEPSEAGQGGAFTTGALLGQGVPAWGEKYLSGYDGTGNVNNTQNFGDGSQALKLEGYGSGTSRLTLDSVTRAPWFEFAFLPQFPDGDEQRIVWSRTTRGGVGDVVGVDLRLLNNATHDIMLGTDAGQQVIGHYMPDEWHTISFEHGLNDVGGTIYYDGSLDVYLNGKHRGHYTSGGLHHYNGLQTMVFSSAEQSWVHNGLWYVDGVHVGDFPIYMPEPTAFVLLALGGLVALRRGRG